MKKLDATVAGLPAVRVAPNAVGPLGLNLGDDAEPGGGTAPRGAFISALTLKWLDEREYCDLVHDFVFFERPPVDLAGCPAFVGGPGHYCRRAGRGAPCAFLEGPAAPIWSQARAWKRAYYRDDAGRAQVAYLYDPDGRHLEGAPLPAGEVEQ